MESSPLNPTALNSLCLLSPVSPQLPLLGITVFSKHFMRYENQPFSLPYNLLLSTFRPHWERRDMCQHSYPLKYMQTHRISC